MNIIIIGASSGIGHELARIYAAKGHTVYATGRRRHLLEQLKSEFPERIRISVFDVCDAAGSESAFEAMCRDLGEVNLVVVNAGWGEINKDLDWEIERVVIETNVTGAARVCALAMRHFYVQKHGHLVGISSVAALMGGRLNPAYNASKAFLSNYLEGLRLAAKAKKLPIAVTDIRPGFVRTAMVKSDVVFWIQPLEKAARQIARAIDRRKKVAYITRRWGLIGWLLRHFW